jgi:uncharacterized membrane protein
MSWQQTDSASLLTLAESGKLSARQLELAAAISPLSPSRAEWQNAADHVLAIAGALLLAAGLIFFFAYNWDDLHRFAKFGMALAALAACVGVALASAPFGTAYRAALLAASFATGALLALIGQTYQTGADVWELFVAWAALVTPFALLSRSSGCWGLWLAVANAGLLRGLSESAWLRFLGALDRPESLFAIAALNGLVLLTFEIFGATLLATPRRHVHRLAGLGVLTPLAFGACIGWWETDFLVVTFAFVAIAASFARAYLTRRRDVPMLALTVFAAIAVSSAALASVLPQGADFVAINLVAVFVIASTAFAGVWLTRLHKEGGDA